MNYIKPINQYFKLNLLDDEFQKYYIKCIHFIVSYHPIIFKELLYLLANLETHIHTIQIILNNRSRQLCFLLTTKHVNLKNKLLIYKLLLLKSIWTSYATKLD
ncbi:Uncharacterized protein FWK35_00029133 [Aphis craccivora]|uniref:Uncharacterized protein n=1 Tax=Aphis craccivora TaxID=307492 RepID=A0A6G0Y064_APHCR|nr:Uncharacterized protein FWK35_00029133 [Aphis craccivora]